MLLPQLLSPPIDVGSIYGSTYADIQKRVRGERTENFKRGGTSVREFSCYILSEVWTKIYLCTRFIAVQSRTNKNL